MATDGAEGSVYIFALFPG